MPGLGKIGREAAWRKHGWFQVTPGARWSARGRAGDPGRSEEGIEAIAPLTEVEREGLGGRELLIFVLLGGLDPKLEVGGLDRLEIAGRLEPGDPSPENIDSPHGDTRENR